MEIAQIGPVQAAVGLALLVFGSALGFLLGRRGRDAAGRVADLERELAEVREERGAFGESVAKHFDQTSDLFRDLTREYTALYAHLAEGARDLCPERAPELAQGFAAPPIAAGFEAPESGPIREGDDREGDADPEPEVAAPAAGDVAAEPEKTGESAEDGDPTAPRPTVH